MVDGPSKDKNIVFYEEKIEELNDALEEANSSKDEVGTWLVSYADLMTLVACFFILMVAFANFDDPLFQEQATSFSERFNASLFLKKGEAQAEIKKGSTENTDVAKKNESPIDPKKKKDLSTHINKQVKSASISEISPPKDIKVIFSGSAMFSPGRVNLSHEVSDSLDVMVDLIIKRKKNFIILFEGHTDDTDIKNKVYPSNWELSAARAARVLRKFEKAGIPSNRLVAVGYGDSKPTYINRDEEGKAIPKNQRLNRRVVIKVLYDKNAPKDNMGLGVFFRDNNKLKKKKKKKLPTRPIIIK
jgi:chemotaxis protein MotB